MRSESAQNETIRQYLLGQLSQEELSQLEERLLADAAFYEELEIEEDELVDQYLRGELTLPESEYFETHFLRVPERQQKLSFAAALKKYVSLEAAGKEQEEPVVDSPAGDVEVPEPPPRWRVLSMLQIPNPVVGFALAAAVLVILFGASWTVLRNWSQREPRDVLTEVLIPGRSRSGDPTEVKKFGIPSSKDTVRLQLELFADDYKVYRTVLQDLSGTIVLQKDLRAQPVSGRPSLILDVPANKLPANSYQIKLKGINSSGNEENIGSYYFAVSK